MTKLWFPVLSSLLLFSFSFAIQNEQWQQGPCDFSSIQAQEPSYSIQAEGGVTEFWDHQNSEYQCAGVSIRRHRIRSKGLLLPLYHSAPVLFYVVQGRGIYGAILSGCPETFEYSQESAESGQGRSQTYNDKHQKIDSIKRGDFVAVAQGSAHWIYNNQDEDLVIVVFHHNSNNANQLDQNPRTFLLAGNARFEQGQGQGQEQGQGSWQGFGNIFKGFADRLLAEEFRVDEQTARRLKGEDDSRGHIITVERGLKYLRPSRRQEESSRGGEEIPYGGGQEEQGQYYNGIRNGVDETICAARVKENLDKPSRADVYNPNAGRFTTLNRHSLPILNFLRLSAARGVLYKNGIVSPRWYLNAHSTVYATKGEARIQIVNHRGQAVFVGQIREEQAVVVPQNFAVLIQAGNEGFEWVEFNTHQNAWINTLSGRTSAIRGMPVDVISNAYQIPTEAAEKLKYGRQETLLFSSRGSSSRGGAEWAAV